MVDLCLPCWIPCWLRSRRPRTTTATTPCRPPPSSGPTKSGSGSGWSPGSRLALPHSWPSAPTTRAARTGPAIWLRCVLAGKIPDVALPPDTVPIIYLPGVSRATLRATEECPPELKPLAELQYRGVFWSQHNGKDWTVSAFLQTEKGGLQPPHRPGHRDPGRDPPRRREADRRPGRRLASRSRRAGPLDSNYFDALLVRRPGRRPARAGSPTRRASGTLAVGTGAVGSAVQPVQEPTTASTPSKDGELVGAEKLGLHAKPAWKNAWKRFAAAPARYAGLVDTAPQGQAAGPRGRPAGELRSRILAPGQRGRGSQPPASPARPDRLPVPAARKRLLDLDAEPPARAGSGSGRSWTRHRWRTPSST